VRRKDAIGHAGRRAAHARSQCWELGRRKEIGACSAPAFLAVLLEPLEVHERTREGNAAYCS